MNKLKINADGGTVPAKAANIEQTASSFDEQGSGIQKVNIAHYSGGDSIADLWRIKEKGGRHLMFEVNSQGDGLEPSDYQTLCLRKAICRYFSDALFYFQEDQLGEMQGVLTQVYDPDFMEVVAAVDGLFEDLGRLFGRLIDDIETLGEAGLP